MGQVIRMAVAQPIKPKTLTGEHGGQRYTVTFDPNAPPGDRWVWVVSYTRVYKMYGASATAEAAAKQARLRIHRMTTRQQLEEESE